MTEEATTKTRKPRPVQEFMVGKWVNEMRAEVKFQAPAPISAVFVPLAKQPPKGTTEVAELVAWSKTALKDEPGEYDVIRRMPGKLTVAVQQTFSAGFSV
jgi:hypothetical protein